MWPAFQIKQLRKFTHSRLATFVAFLTCFVACQSIPARAIADITITIQDVGANVVAMGGGTINTTALTDTGPTHSVSAADVHASDGDLTFGPGTSSGADFWIGITGPSAWGSGGHISATTTTTTIIDINGSEESSPFLALPTGYTSGAHLSGTDTWTGQSISSLGLTPGTYAYTWGSGASADFFTVIVAAESTAVPEPTTLWLAVIGCVAFIAHGRFARSKNQRRATLACGRSGRVTGEGDP